jgi:hypothetical protein
MVSVRECDDPYEICDFPHNRCFNLYYDQTGGKDNRAPGMRCLANFDCHDAMKCVNEKCSGKHQGD